MEDIKILSDLYKEYYGAEPDSAYRLTASGGDRIYWRLESAAGRCIGTAGDSLAECRSFVELARIFHKRGVPVPEIYAVARDGMHYIQEDLGDVALFSLIGKPEWRTLMEKSLESLVKMQTVAPELWEKAVAFAPFSRRMVMWDLNYFKYEYLKPLRIPFDEERLQDDFDRLADRLTGPESGPQGFMMRDCQSRNIMIKDGDPYWIDFQGGRRGPVVYDPVSLLWQAKARISPAAREELMILYAAEFEKTTGVPADKILRAVPIMALFRTLQVLGAYGFRGIVEKRAHFIESIAPALENLANAYPEALGEDFPELSGVCRYAVEHSPVPAPHEGLLIKVYSFSYKRGYPRDFTGNGGGFMFDCRGMYNPGRYDEYKPLTGLDKPVRDFLEARGEVQQFIAKAVDLVAPSVECYLRRGFSDLQIGFGCTGGRHRSVYCAEGTARELARRFPDAKVKIIHREQNIETDL